MKFKQTYFRFTFACMVIFALGCGRTTSTFDNVNIARISKSDSSRAARVVNLKSGERLELTTLDGPGVIRHIWFTAKSDDPKAYAGLILRVWWDGEEEPSIETPFGDFFGVGFGEERLVESAAVEMIPAGMPGHAALNCWLPMPFESARVEVENQNSNELALFYIINWERVDKLDDEMGRLHAQWRRSNPVVRGRGHTVLQAQGEGHYIGVVYSQHRLEGGAWVEGGEDFYIDIPSDEWAALEFWNASLVSDPNRRPEDEERSIANQPMGPLRPTLSGIGCEDYFGLAWGFSSRAQLPFHGVTFGPEDGEENGRLSAYRFHLKDPIRFRKNLWVHFRNHGWDVQARADDITTVAFWFQREPHAQFPELPRLNDRIPE